MNCPVCGTEDSRVLETRDNGQRIARRRTCPCGARWTTEERPKRSTVTPTARGQTSLGLDEPNTAGRGPENTTGSETDTRCSSLLRSGSVSIPDPDSDLSKPIRTEIVNMMGESGVVARLPPSLFHRALGLFCETWKARYGKPYRPTGADRNQLGRALNDLQADDYADVPVAFRNYLDDLDPWVAHKHRHSLMCFCCSGGFNKYRTRAPVVSVKEARTMETLRNWKERHSNGIDK